jgi:hypothetical protein
MYIHMYNYIHNTLCEKLKNNFQALLNYNFLGPSLSNVDFFGMIENMFLLIVKTRKYSKSGSILYHFKRNTLLHMYIFIDKIFSLVFLFATCYARIVHFPFFPQNYKLKTLRWRVDVVTIIYGDFCQICTKILVLILVWSIFWINQRYFELKNAIFSPHFSPKLI